MTSNPILFDGVRSIPLNALPEEAWQYLPSNEPIGQKEIRQFYAEVGMMFRCVHIRAAGVAKVPWRILDDNENVIFSYEDHKYPADMEWVANFKQLLYLIECSLSLTSQAFLAVESNRLGTRNDLRWLSPLSITPIWDERKGLVGFDRKISDTETKRLKPEEVVYIWRPHPLYETKPDISPGRAAIPPSNIINNVDKFVELYFKRGAIRATILALDGNPPPDERDRIERWWERVARGIRNAWASKVVNAKSVTATVIGEGLESLANKELTRERKEDIATAMGVPHSIVLSNAANYATSAQDKVNFYDDTVIPETDLIGTMFDQQYGHKRGWHLRFYPKELDIYQEQEATRAQSFAYYVANGMKRSVAAQVLGIDMPVGVAYEDLDKEPMPGRLGIGGQPHAETGSQTGSTGQGQQTNQSVDVQLILEEKQRYRRWLRKRHGKAGFDTKKFESDLLSPKDRADVEREFGLDE